jgi:hypothetical protein
MPEILALLTGLPQFFSIGVSIVHHVETLFGRGAGSTKAQAFSGALGDLVNLTQAGKSEVPAGMQSAITAFGTIATTVLNTVHGKNWPSSLSAINAAEVGEIVQTLLPTVTQLAGNDVSKIASITTTLLNVAPTIQGLLKAA